MFTIKVFTEYEKKIMYIKELNNNIVIDKDYLEDGNYRFNRNELLDVIKNQINEEYEKFNKIIIKYIKHVENGLYFKGDQSFVYKLTMHPSRQCNLKCKYCFADTANYLPTNEIDFQTAKDAVDFLVDEFGRHGIKYQVDISGSGEPLLRFNFIKELNEYCKKKSNETGKDIKIMFPTNAILLSDDMAEYFNKESNILVGVSIDGNKIHSANRVLKNGREAYTRISKGIKKLARPFGIAVTITHINEAVDEVYDYLYNEFEYADCISMQLVRNYEKSSELSFYNIDMKNLIKHYKKLADNLYKHVMINDYEYIFKILRGQDTFGSYLFMTLHKGEIKIRRCGAGMNMISVDDKGDLYSCSVVNGDLNFKIGNLTEGIDREQNQKFITPSITMNKKCNECWASYMCGGECHVKAFMVNGNIYTPNDAICQVKYELIKLAIGLVEKIRSSNFEAYKILKAFRIDPTKTDSSLWAVNRYLKIRNRTIKYSELENSAVRGKYGMNPNNMLKLIQHYEPKTEVFNIDNEELYKMISYPAVAFLDKYKYGYRYLIIDSYEEGKIKTHNIQSYDPIYFSFEQFSEEMSNTIMSVIKT